MVNTHSAPLPCSADGLAQNLIAHYVSYDEAGRLEATIRGRLEATRVRELISRYLPPTPCAIADIGGAAGAHAVWMQGLGHTVDLIDPMAHHVEQARRAGVPAVVGDARDLPWKTGTFDAALLAGPLYHLIDPHNRHMALREAARVTRPGGVVVAVGLNRHANLIGAALAGQLMQRQRIVHDIEQAGWSTANDRWSAQTYYHTVGELHDELTEAGIQVADIHGVAGIGGWLAVVTDRYGLDDEEGHMLRTALLAARMSDHYPELVHTSAGLLAVGRVGGQR
ncbi:hypothetical protein GCM10027290_52430 [Micromonospora sonneratiae]|uniref:Class I SAM-dependent methyltransferase n=1 Tax=Micromonospora sonneratiae TaxID=1184706 RepID=A0ABW3Y9W1_9ACTN